MKNYRVNIDYEASLFASNYDSSQKKYILQNREFEHIFFFMNKEKCSLATYNNYDEKYISYLKDLGCFIPTFNKNYDQAEAWWGKHQDREVARHLNSKLTSTKIAKELSWQPNEVIIVNHFDEVINHLEKNIFNSWLLRSPFGMSGQGSLRFIKKDLEDNEKIAKFLNFFKRSPGVLSPFFERTLDLGRSFKFADGNLVDSYWVQNLIAKDGSFKGGRCGAILKELLKDKGNLDEYELTTNQIASYYAERFQLNHFQIDSFFYSERNENLLYPLVEINARKSMGGFLRAMESYLPDNSFGRWSLLPRRRLKPFKSFEEIQKALKDYLFEDKKQRGVILISPFESQFFSFFTISNTLDEESELINNIWSIIGASNTLPPELVL